MTELAFNDFLKEIQCFIQKTPDLIILIKKRYNECTSKYRTSDEFQDFLDITRAKILSDSSRVFVHLRDFLSELKCKKSEQNNTKKRKREGSGSDDASSPKSFRDYVNDSLDSDASDHDGNHEVLYKQQINESTAKVWKSQNVLIGRQYTEPEINGHTEYESENIKVKEINHCIGKANGSQRSEIQIDKNRGNQRNNFVETDPKKGKGGEGKTSVDSLEEKNQEETLYIKKNKDLKTDIPKETKAGFLTTSTVFDGAVEPDFITIDDDEEEGEEVVPVKKELSKSEVKVESSCTKAHDDQDVVNDDEEVIVITDSQISEHSENTGENSHTLGKDFNLIEEKCTNLVNKNQEREDNNVKTNTDLVHKNHENDKETCTDVVNGRHGSEDNDKETCTDLGKENLEKRDTDRETKCKDMKNDGTEFVQKEKSKRDSINILLENDGNISEEKVIEQTIKREGDLSNSECQAKPSESVDSTVEPVKKGSQRQIGRLEKLLEDLRNKIEELKTKELSLDALEEEDSIYIQEDRYQKKFVKVWNKLCELKGAQSDTGRPVERRFVYKGTRYPEINRKLEKFVNKHKIFPDFHDVQKVIRDTSKRKNISLSGAAIDRLAREAFHDIGELLQKRRISDLRKTSPGHLPSEYLMNEDPATKDMELRKKLEENRKASKGKLEAVLEKFCQRQEDVHLEEEEDDEKSEEDIDNTDVPEMTDILEEENEEEQDSPENQKLPQISTSKLQSVLSTSPAAKSLSQVKHITCAVSLCSLDVTEPHKFSSGVGHHMPVHCPQLSLKTAKPVHNSPSLKSPEISSSIQKETTLPCHSSCSPNVSLCDQSTSSSSACNGDPPKLQSSGIINSSPHSSSKGSNKDTVDGSRKKPGPLVSLEDYMDSMPVLHNSSSNSFTSGKNKNFTSDFDNFEMKIDSVISLANDNSNNKEKRVDNIDTVSAHNGKKCAKTNLELHYGNNGHIKPNGRVNNESCTRDLSDKNKLSGQSDSKTDQDIKPCSKSFSPVKHSIMFRNMKKTISLVPFSKVRESKSITVDVDSDPSSSTPGNTNVGNNTHPPKGEEEDVIEISDSD